MTATTEVRVPDIGNFEQVEIIEVMVNPGDEINKDDSLITLETDKAAMDIPAPLSGKVVEVLVKTGDRVSAGDLILILMPTAGADLSVVKEVEVLATKVEKPAAKPVEPIKPKPVTLLAAATTLVPVDFNKVYAGPAIRRFARELGVDLNRVQGSGDRGRILREDVTAFVKVQLSQGMQVPAGSLLPEMPVVDFSEFGAVEVKPLSRIKQLTAKNLHRNWVLLPHVTQFAEADISELEQFRKDNKSKAASLGVKLTPLLFIMKAVVVALEEFPQFNASLAPNGTELIYKKYFHIGVAVDTPNGLVVPVIRDVNTKDVWQLAAELVDVSSKARAGKLTAKEMQGGSFTISSLGGIGGTAFTPIINAPEVAILGVSKAEMKPVYVNDGFVPRLKLPLSLSYDHRVIDGAEAARFTNCLTENLQNIAKLKQ